MAQTANFNLEKPDITRDVDEEFYQLQETLDLLDTILKTLQDAVNSKAASTHTHTISQVIGLAAELAAKMPASQTFKLDDLTDVDGADGAPNGYVLVKTALGWLPSSALAALGPHGHLISEITGLVDALSGKANVGHSHAIADVTGLSGALDNRVRFDAAQSKTQAERGQARANIGASVLSGFRDKIINGDGQINQRSYTTVADDVYWCDRHYVLAQTAAITPTILNDVADGLASMMRLSQTQATAQRMGNAQIIESAVAKRRRGKKVTLGGKLRCSAAQAIRFAVLEWTGTADAVTSDVVLNWASGSYTAGGFFLASNVTVAAVGSITPAANTITDWSLVADISSACNNLILIYWTEGTAAQNVTLDMAWGLVDGDASAEVWPYDARHTQQELTLCQRYYLAGAGTVKFQASTSAADTPRVMVWFKTTMRATPTLSLTDIANTGFPAGVPSTELLSPDGFAAFKTASASGNSSFSFTYRAEAEL